MNPSNRSVVKTPAVYTSVQQALDECVRELKVRQRCYDKWVAEGKLTETEALQRYAALCSACHHLDRLQALDSYNGHGAAPPAANITNLSDESPAAGAVAG